MGVAAAGAVKGVYEEDINDNFCIVGKRHVEIKGTKKNICLQKFLYARTQIFREVMPLQIILSILRRR